MSLKREPYSVSYENGYAIVKDDVVIEVRCEEEVHRIVVPKGFSSDGASIPRFLWFLCGRPLESNGIRGYRLHAAIVHDYMYHTKLFARKECDCIYRKLLEEYGVNPIRALIEYGFIRMFGERYFGT